LAFGMNTSRGPGLALSLLAILWIASPGRAQAPEEPSAVIRLVAQTAWTRTTPKKPLLRITLRISNNGEAPIVDPDIVWTLGPKVTSRVQYETALDEGPELTASAETVHLPGDLAPGSSTEVAIRIDSSETGGIVQDDSGVYPLKLELRSEDQPIAAVTTAAIHIFQRPQKPVQFSWWTEVATPVAFGPDGTLIDPGFEVALGSHGGVVAQVEALADLLRLSPAGAPIDVIVSPAALDQLRQAEDGYVRSDGTSVPADAPAPEAAAETLDRLREIAGDPGARLHAMPFAAPRLPALQSSPLRAHLEEQWRLGDETFEQILDERPDPTVARPPGLDFDQTSVDLLDARGVTTILGATDSVDRPRQPNDYAPPPAATLSTTSGNRIELLLPDPGAQALVSDAELLEDPVRAAQVVLGELATIWKEEPVPPPDEMNGLALELPPDLPAAIWGPMVLRLSRAPFLNPVHAEDLPESVKPPPLNMDLESPAPEVFSTTYADDLAATGRRVAAFGAILEEPVGEVDLLRRSMLYAEASQYIQNEGSGHVWIDGVKRVIDGTFSRLRPDTSRVLTFTSRSGTIPLRMGDPGDRVLNVKVVLASGRVEFLDGKERTVRLDQANQVITFLIEVKAAGPSDIDVFVTSPNGVVLSQSVLVVRSTAVNPIALIITIGAGLVLIGLWSRRLFRRRHP
jgi:hypothetical protein